MKSYKQVLEIFKCGIWPFLEITVKLQQDELLGKVLYPASSGFTRFETCSECNKQNIKPRHSEDTCPSSNLYLCRNKRGEIRPCPKGICDLIYGGIIQDHYTYSPNMKTTDISQWTTSYWDIALCYMRYKSETAETTNLLELLHLMAKNRFILKTIIHSAKPGVGNGPEETEDQLSAVHAIVYKSIKACEKIKRTPGRCSDNDIDLIIAVLKMINDKHAKEAIKNLNEVKSKLNPEGAAQECEGEEASIETIFEMNRKAVTEYTRNAGRALQCKGSKTNDDSLNISARQRVDILGTNGKDVSGTRQSVTEMIFEAKTPQKYVVTKAMSHSREYPEINKAKWDEYQWLIYNILIFFLQTKSKEKNLSNFTISSVFVISKAFCDRMTISLHALGAFFRNPELEKHRCLFIFDVRDLNIRREFENVHESLLGHTTLTIVDNIEKIITQENKGSFVRLKLHPVTELVIIHKTEKTKPGHFSKLVENTVRKCMTKIEKNSLSKLTLENICFEDISTKVKMSFVPNLKQLVIRSCNFTPSLPSTLHYIQIQKKDKSSCLDQLKQVFKEAIQTCPELKYIKTSDMKIGAIEFRIKLDMKKLETFSKKIFGKTLIGCTNERADEILDNSISEIIDETNCNFRDYEGANEVERKAILNGMCYGLGKSDPNLYVNPAVYHCKEKEEIVLVGYMKENFDMDKECSWGNYRGFKTYHRSYYHVNTEKLCEEYPFQNTSEQEAYFKNHYKNINETIHKYSAELMKRHSNLEIIGVSSRNDRTDPSFKPCIALYVRLKSFVPYGESLFPSELSHPSRSDIVYKTDVREGYFMQLADTEADMLNPLLKLQHLAMGCSIGCKDNDNGASLGPFVEYDFDNVRKTGFLTARHLFSLAADDAQVIGTEVVQPSESDVFPDIRLPNQETRTSSVCGTVIVSSYTDEVDACLVHITDRTPYTGLFCYRMGDLRKIEKLKDCRILKYTDGSIAELGQLAGRTLVKFGKDTFMTSGQCILENSAVKLSGFDPDVTCPTTGVQCSHPMINQIEIKGFRGQPFCGLGDSGAGVFLINEDKSLSCAGIIIGMKVPSNNCIVTPIETVLRRLSKDYSNEVTLKKFT